MTGDTEARPLSCRWCRERVLVDGDADPEFAKAVHEDGRERCAGGEHLAAPIAQAGLSAGR